MLLINFVLTSIITAEVVTQWSFEGNLKDTASSGIQNDDLKAFGEPEFVPGVPGLDGSAVKLSADGAHRLRAKDSWDLDLEESWTLEVFVWPDENNSGEWDRLWLKWGDGGNQWHFALRSFGSVKVNNGIDFVINGGTWVLESNDTAEVPLMKWSHLAMVGDFNKDTITAWLNGVKVGEAPYREVKPGSGAVNFGNFQNPANSLQYTGFIDEALIHDTAVTEDYLRERSKLLVPLEPPSDIILIDTALVASETSQGKKVTEILVLDANEGETHEIKLVAGEGDDHNSLFTVNGNNLLAASTYTQLIGNKLSIRLNAVDPSGAELTKILELSVENDEDQDGLHDSWEISHANSLGELNGAGDFDSDNLTNLDEFKIGTNPMIVDSDGDGLDDGEEIANLTNPLESDTDGDGLSDFEELTNAVQTDPNNPDSDLDGFNDLIEINDQTNPNDDSERPFRSIVHFGEIDIFQGADDLDLNGEILYAINCFDDDHGLQGIRNVVIQDIEFISDHTLEIEGYSTTSDTGGNLTSYDFTNGFSSDNKELNELLKRTRCCGAPSDLFSFSVTQGDIYKIQILWGENGFDATKRTWDIGFEGEIAVDDVASNGLITENTAPRTTSSDGTRWSHTFTAQDDTLEIEIGQIVGGVAGELPKYTVSAFILSKLGSAPISPDGPEPVFTYAEADHGDLSSNAAEPTVIPWKGIGVYEIGGRAKNFQQVNSDPEYFTLTVPEGHELTGVSLREYVQVGYEAHGVPMGNGGFMGIGLGGSLPVIASPEDFPAASSALIGGALIGVRSGLKPGEELLDDLQAPFSFSFEDLDLVIPGFEGNLGAGTYTFMLKEGNPDPETADGYINWSLRLEVVARFGITSYRFDGNELTIEFNGKLWSASSIDGPWEEVINSTSPYRVTASESNRFYQCINDPH